MVFQQSSLSSTDSSPPIADRVLRQPHRLTVATNEPTSSSSRNSTEDGKIQALYARQAKLQHLAEKWSDRMMEQALDQDTFKRAVSLLSIQHPAHPSYL